ncbi:MAG: hypothetical protein ABIO17_12685 [Pseudoxanthomonas sp.]
MLSECGGNFRVDIRNAVTVDVRVRKYKAEQLRKRTIAIQVIPAANRGAVIAPGLSTEPEGTAVTAIGKVEDAECAAQLTICVVAFATSGA